MAGKGNPLSHHSGLSWAYWPTLCLGRTQKLAETQAVWVCETNPSPNISGSQTLQVSYASLCRWDTFSTGAPMAETAMTRLFVATLSRAPSHFTSPLRQCLRRQVRRRACDILSQGAQRGVGPVLFSRPRQLHRAPGEATREGPDAVPRAPPAITLH